MGALKLREYYNYPELRKLRNHGNKSSNKGFMIVIAILFAAFFIFSSTESESKEKPETTKTDKIEPKPETKETFTEFIERVLKDEPTKRETYHLANISNTMQQKLKDSVKLNLKGFEWVISSSDILHMRNRHGNFKKESSRGQINITTKDYQKIFSIINAPDNIDLSVNVKSGEKFLKLSKYFNKQKYTYIVSISKKKWRLAGKTMYIKKAPTIKSMPF